VREGFDRGSPDQVDWHPRTSDQLVTREQSVHQVEGWYEVWSSAGRQRLNVSSGKAHRVGTRRLNAASRAVSVSES
jgi:hypothetical protein